jgi:hypothetical protein
MLEKAFLGQTSEEMSPSLRKMWFEEWDEDKEGFIDFCIRQRKNNRL